MFALRTQNSHYEIIIFIKLNKIRVLDAYDLDENSFEKHLNKVKLLSNKEKTHRPRLTFLLCYILYQKSVRDL